MNEYDIQFEVCKFIKFTIVNYIDCMEFIYIFCYIIDDINIIKLLHVYYDKSYRIAPKVTDVVILQPIIICSDEKIMRVSPSTLKIGSLCFDKFNNKYTPLIKKTRTEYVTLIVTANLLQ